MGKAAVSEQLQRPGDSSPSLLAANVVSDISQAPDESGGEARSGFGVSMKPRTRPGLWTGAIRSEKQADAIIRLAGWPGIVIGLLILVSCIQNLGALEPLYAPLLFYGRIGLAVAFLAPSSVLLLYRSRWSAICVFVIYVVSAATWLIVEVNGLRTGYESAAAVPVFVVLSVVLLFLSCLCIRAARAARALSRLKISGAFD